MRYRTVEIPEEIYDCVEEALNKQLKDLREDYQSVKEHIENSVEVDGYAQEGDQIMLDQFKTEIKLMSKLIDGWYE